MKAVYMLLVLGIVVSMVAAQPVDKRGVWGSIKSGFKKAFGATKTFFKLQWENGKAWFGVHAKDIAYDFAVKKIQPYVENEESEGLCADKCSAVIGTIPALASAGPLACPALCEGVFSKLEKFTHDHGDNIEPADASVDKRGVWGSIKSGFKKAFGATKTFFKLQWENGKAWFGLHVKDIAYDFAVKKIQPYVENEESEDLCADKCSAVIGTIPALASAGPLACPALCEGVFARLEKFTHDHGDNIEPDASVDNIEPDEFVDNIEPDEFVDNIEPEYE